MTREELIKVENELLEILQTKGIFGELSVNNGKILSNDFITIHFDLEGDWKHEHLYSTNLINEYCENNEWKITGRLEDVYDSDSDWYRSIYTYHICLNKQLANVLMQLV